MIPNRFPREVIADGVVEQTSFGISENDISSILEILRSTLYSDKILAVLREYSSNAWDAHRSIGKGDVPIKVTLPTLEEPTLTIQDFGPGLSHQGVFEVFSQYGASTKRNDDESVGFLGIGGKSGFSYSDSFTIISCHGGTRRTYVAVIDVSEKGVINLLHTEPCEDTGVTIQIAVKQYDIGTFESKAKELFQYFEPRPEINTTLLPPVKRLAHGSLMVQSNYSTWTAVMGCIPYTIDVDELFENPDEYGSPESCVRKMSGVLYFNIGDVQVNASREALKYSDATKRALIKKFNVFVAEYIETALRELSDPIFSAWQRRVKAQYLRKFELKLDSLKGITSEWVEFSSISDEEEKAGQPQLFSHTRIRVMDDSRIIVQDDARKLAGFSLNEHDKLVKLLDEDKQKARVALDAAIVKHGLTGIPVVSLSSLPWVKPAPKYPNRTVNIKHRVKTFELTKTRWSGSRSECWDVVSRTPTADDVFVVLSNFQSERCDVYNLAHRDRTLAKVFAPQKSMPTIYGYKTTFKKPVSSEDCIGTHYSEWSKKFTEELLADPKVLEKIEQYAWANLEIFLGSSYEEFEKAFGKDHELSIGCKKYYDGKLALNKGAYSDTDTNVWNWVKVLADRIDRARSTARLALDKIFKKYPLLEVSRSSYGGSYYMPWREQDFNKWVQYIKLVDAAAE